MVSLNSRPRVIKKREKILALDSRVFGPVSIEEEENALRGRIIPGRGRCSYGRLMPRVSGGS